MPIRLDTPLSETVQPPTEKTIAVLRIRSYSVVEARDDADNIVLDDCKVHVYMQRAVNAEETSWINYQEPYVLRNVKPEEEAEPAAGVPTTVNGVSFNLVVGDHFTTAATGIPDGVANRRVDNKTAMYTAWLAMGYHAGTVE